MSQSDYDLDFEEDPITPQKPPKTQKQSLDRDECVSCGNIRVINDEGLCRTCVKKQNERVKLTDLKDPRVDKMLEELKLNEDRNKTLTTMVSGLQFKMADLLQQNNSLSRDEILNLFFNGSFAIPKHKKLFNYLQKAKYSTKSKNNDYRLESIITFIEMLLLHFEVRER